MNATILILLVFWDIEISLDPKDFPGASFTTGRIGFGSNFYEEASKFKRIIVLINKNSTLNDKGVGNISLTAIKDYLVSNEKLFDFLEITEQNFIEIIKKSPTFKN